MNLNENILYRVIDCNKLWDRGWYSYYGNNACTGGSIKNGQIIAIRKDIKVDKYKLLCLGYDSQLFTISELEQAIEPVTEFTVEIFADFIKNFRYPDSIKY